MFIRNKKNPNGSITIQIIDKSSGKYRVIKNYGVTKTAAQQAELIQLAQMWIKERKGIMELDLFNEDNKIEELINGIKSLRRHGLELVLGKIYNEIGFDRINDPMLRYLVFYRLVYPSSKLKTTEYLYRYHEMDWDENKIYRYLDKLHNTQKEFIQQISYDHTVKILDEQPQVIFYDVTTLYFEIEKEDELRRTGFSKDGKHQNPQIVLGLLVSKNGYPLAYEIFEGKKFEGHTLIPVIDKFKTKYNIENLVIVADSGLLSHSNIDMLVSKNYSFILGARIKNENRQLQKEILSASFKNGDTKIFNKTSDIRLIVSYSEKRAAKDKTNRERGLKRLEKLLGKGRLTKGNINNKGYNKYLKLEGDIQITIDYEKFKSDNIWDGLKGYITNCSLAVDEILENYNHLWQIEKAFRVTKTDLKIRPIYHRLPKRIEAHICLNFVAYKVYKELERQLTLKNAPIKAHKAIEIAESIFQIHVELPMSKSIFKHTILLKPEQKLLARLFDF